MDLNQYKQLDSDKKYGIWERLENNPDFQLLKLIFEKEMRIVARPTNQDAKEAFLYESIRAQAIADVLFYPSDQIGERKKYLVQASQDLNIE